MNMNLGDSRAKFVDTSIAIKAAADYLGNGAIETNRYETEITDIVRRESEFLTRVAPRPATGHPHRYFDQTAIAQGGFTDPRVLATTPTGPTRLEKAVYIKAVTAESDFTLFDIDVTRMQGQFAYVEAKDVEDIISGVTVTEAAAVWGGTATSISDSATASFCGLLTQITNQYTIGLGASIIDGLKAKIAAMFANPTSSPRPTAIYLNPILNDLIDREAKAAHIDLGTMNIRAGVTVKSLATQAGEIPLISDPYILADTTGLYGFAAPGTGNSNYFAVILTESLLERPVVHGADGNLQPRMFQLGLQSGLQGKFVAVHFSAVVAKRSDVAHAVVAVVRPTVAAI
jgi:hypothetical protein